MIGEIQANGNKYMNAGLGFLVIIRFKCRTSLAECITYWIIPVNFVQICFRDIISHMEKSEHTR